MRRFGYLVVEGPHDVEFVARLIESYGIMRIRKVDDLDPYFVKLVPTKYPPDGDLMKRVPVPLFLQSSTHSIAVHSAVGDSQLVKALNGTAGLLEDRPDGIGLLLDADDRAPQPRHAALRTVAAEKGFRFPAEPGLVQTIDGTRYGIFVLPDNRTRGTLEDLLRECAATVYPQLLREATTFVTAARSLEELTPTELTEVGKPAGEGKAILGAMANILRPGKAVQVSLQDNRWLRGDALDLPRIKSVCDFLRDLFAL